MCHVHVIEYTPSLSLARPVTVSVDRARLASSLKDLLLTPVTDDDPGRERYYANLEAAIAKSASPSCPPGSEYVVDDPLEVLTDVLAEA